MLHIELVLVAEIEFVILYASLPCCSLWGNLVVITAAYRVDINVPLWDSLQEEQITTAAAEERVLSHKSLQNDISWNANSRRVIF